MSREQKIYSVSLIVLVGFAFSVFCHYVKGVYLKLEYPINTFLFRPDDRFMDFIHRYRDMATPDFNPYNEVDPAYIAFPVLYQMVRPFTLINESAATILFLVLFTVSFFIFNLSEIKIKDKFILILNALIFSFLSYPFLFAFDRANYEIVVFFFLYLFILLYNKNSMVSALFLGLAIALKAFPVVIAVLLLSDKRYKEFVFAGVVALSTTLIGYLSFPGGLLSNITGQLHNLELYNKLYGGGMDGLYFGNSLFGGVKFIALYLSAGSTQSNPSYFNNLVSGYTVFALIGVCVFMIYILYVEKKFWKKVTVAVCALNLFPLVSADYKLLHFFIPLFLFINKPDSDLLDWLYLILFSFLLIPKDYYHLRVFPEASISVLINPLLMLALVIVIMINGVKARLHSHSSETEPCDV